MSDFDTGIELSLTVPQRELDNVAQQIEDSVGVTEIGVTDGGSMSAQTAAGGGGRARRRARQSFRMERTRTDLLEDAVGYLEELEDKAGQGGGGGSITDDLVGAVVETGGDVATEGAGMLGDIATQTIGTAIGTAVADAVRGTEVAVEKPSWTPLEVERPEAIDVETPPGPIEFESLPGPVKIEELPGPVGFETLPGPVGFAELPGPVAIESPSSPYPVEDVEPLEIEPLDVEVTVNTPGGGGGSSGGSGSYEPDSWGDTFDERIADGVDFLTPGEDIRTDKEGGEGQSPGDWFGERWSEGVDYINPFDDGSSGGSTSGNTSPPAGSNSSGASRPGRGQGGQEVSVTVNLDSRNDVVVEPDSADIADDVISEVEKFLQDALDDLRDDLRDAEDDIDRLEQALRGRG